MLQNAELAIEVGKGPDGLTVDPYLHLRKELTTFSTSSGVWMVVPEGDGAVERHSVPTVGYSLALFYRKRITLTTFFVHFSRHDARWKIRQIHGTYISRICIDSDDYVIAVPHAYALHRPRVVNLQG